MKVSRALPGWKCMNGCSCTKGGRSPNKLLSAANVFKAHPWLHGARGTTGSSDVTELTLVLLQRSPGVSGGTYGSV